MKKKNVAGTRINIFGRKMFSSSVRTNIANFVRAKVTRNLLFRSNTTILSYLGLRDYLTLQILCVRLAISSQEIT